MILQFQRRVLILLVLTLTCCSIPDADQESEMLDGVRRYVVTVGLGRDTFKENMYLVFDPNTSQAVIIDPGARSPQMEQCIASQQLGVLLILNTHGHFDHTSANHYYSALYRAPILVHQADAEFFVEENAVNKPEKYYAPGDPVTAALDLRLLETPGHSPGSVCYLIRGRLFTGDTLFQGSIGRIWAATEAEEKTKTAALIQEIKSKLLAFPEDTLVFPGHGEFTHIGHEKQYNRYLH